MKPNTSVSTESTNKVVCPYCMSEHCDQPEFEGYYDQDSHDYECEYCGKTFELVAFIQVSWSTYKKDDQEDEIPN